jgi:hypothetical protein
MNSFLLSCTRKKWQLLGTVLQMASQEAAIADFKESLYLPENVEGNDPTCFENVWLSGWDSNREQPCHI